MSHNLPLIIEIIDQKENLDRLLPFLDEVIKEGLVTLEEIQIIKFDKKRSN
jgi:PII-like signaling protein